MAALDIFNDPNVKLNSATLDLGRGSSASFVYLPDIADEEGNESIAASDFLNDAWIKGVNTTVTKVEDYWRVEFPEAPGTILEHPCPDGPLRISFTARSNTVATPLRVIVRGVGGGGLIESQNINLTTEWQYFSLTFTLTGGVTRLQLSEIGTDWVDMDIRGFNAVPISNAPVSHDDVVVGRVHDEIVYKGIVRKISRNLKGEEARIEVEGAEQIIESQEWIAVNDYYNTDDVFAGTAQYGRTIQEVITAEHVGVILTLFPTISIPAAVGSLVAGSASTIHKGFVTFLQEIMAPYPHLQWVIDYDTTAETLLPLGTLRIIDTTVGRNPVALQVGGPNPDVIDATVVTDSSNTAEDIRVWARGDLVEAYEILTPDWLAEEEQIVFGPASLKMPEESFQTSVVYRQHDRVMTEPVIDITGGHPDAPFTCFGLGRDFFFNYETGEIHWNTFDYWIDKTTGQLTLGTQPQPPNTRKIAGFANNHLNSDATIQYTFMGDNCYRRYKTSKPLANFRAQLVNREDPDNPGTSRQELVSVPDVIQAYKPIMWGTLRPNDQDPSSKEPEPDQLGTVNDVTGTPLLAEFYTFSYPFDSAVAQKYQNPIASPEFEEGGDVVMFQERQMVIFGSVWSEQPSVSFKSWDLMCHYTQWNPLKADRVGTSGLSKKHNEVHDNLLKYTDAQGTVLQDDTTKLGTVADKSAALVSAPRYEGNAEIQLSYNDTSGKWEVPVKVGDLVSFVGEVEGDFAVFSGIVNQINLGAIDQGKATLGFGPLPPRGRFEPAPELVVDVEAVSDVRFDRSGLTNL